MARKKSPRNLPGLPKLKVSDIREHKAETLLQTLRHIAGVAQEQNDRIFYSMREISFEYRTPVSAVADIYRLLEREGLLRRVRGSKTLLRGRQHDRKISVRGVVGLPRMTSKYVTIQDYRLFLKHLRRELRLSGFAAQTVDTDGPEAADFVERVRNYDVDTIIWFQPGQLAKQVKLRLQDLGLRIIGVSDGMRPTIPCQYEVQREPAVRQILRHWRSEAALSSILVVSGSGSSPAVLGEEQLAEIAEEEGLDVELCHAQGRSIRNLLEMLSQKEDVGIVFLSSAGPLVAFRSPESMTEIFEHCRVALVEGPVNMPFAKLPDVRVDLVLLNWQLIAQKIVGDLIIDTDLSARNPVTFLAESRLRVPLSRYAEVI
jgi:hypothetical protein